MAALLEVLGYASTPSAVRRRIERLRADDHYGAWVTVLDRQVAGYAAAQLMWPLEYDQPAVRLIRLAVLPEHQNRGLATALLQSTEAWARDHDAREIHLTSGTHRDEAHDFYLRRGFAQTGFRFRKLL